MSRGLLGVIGQVRIWDLTDGKTMHNFSMSENPFVTGISVTLGHNIISSINVTFDIPYEKGIELLDSNIFAHKNPIAVRLGFIDPDMITPWYYGVLYQGGIGLEISPNGLTGTISARNAPEQTSYEPTGDEKTEDKTALDVIERIGEYLGYDVDVKDNAAERLNIVYEEGRSPVVHGNKTNWDILRNLTDLYGVRYWIGSKDAGGQAVQTLFVESELDMTSGKANRKYIMRGKFDPVSLQWPIFTISPSSNAAIWDGLPPDNTAKGAKASYVDDRRGEVVTVEVEQKDLNVHTSGVISESESEDVEVEGFKVDASQTDRAAKGGTISLPAEGGEKGEVDIREQLTSICQSGSAGLRISINTIGTPMEVPGNLILVNGCSKRYDGLYMIEKITHTFANGDFSSTIDALRRGSTDKREKGDKTAAGEQPENYGEFGPIGSPQPALL